VAVEDEAEGARPPPHSYAYSLVRPARRLMNDGNGCPIPSLGRSLSAKLQSCCEDVGAKVRKGVR